MFVTWFSSQLTDGEDAVDWAKVRRLAVFGSVV